LRSATKNDRSLPTAQISQEFVCSVCGTQAKERFSACINMPFVCIKFADSAALSNNMLLFLSTLKQPVTLQHLPTLPPLSFFRTNQSINQSADKSINGQFDVRLFKVPVDFELGM
jgi:hypothetical protein